MDLSKKSKQKTQAEVEVSSQSGSQSPKGWIVSVINLTRYSSSNKPLLVDIEANSISNEEAEEKKKRIYQVNNPLRFEDYLFIASLFVSAHDIGAVSDERGNVRIYLKINVYDLLKVMNLDNSGKNYQKVYNILKKLSQQSIELYCYLPRLMEEFRVFGVIEQFSYKKENSPIKGKSKYVIELNFTSSFSHLFFKDGRIRSFSSKELLQKIYRFPKLLQKVVVYFLSYHHRSMSLNEVIEVLELNERSTKKIVRHYLKKYIKEHYADLESLGFSFDKEVNHIYYTQKLTFLDYFMLKDEGNEEEV